jgi:hypothetical protein
MFSYEAVKDNARLFLAMTGLVKTEFEKLLPEFQKGWDEYVQQAYIDRAGRQRQYGAGLPEATLVKIEDKLLFILYYVKVYPLQEILAFEFGMAQSTANEWVHILSQVLKAALAEGGHLPAREAEKVSTVLPVASEPEYAIDGTERRRTRPVDQEKQELYYSGKKKRIRSKMWWLAG